MTALECECECLFMIVAGSDTTSSTIRMAMLHLITSPRIYNRLKEVIREAVQSGNASSPINIEEAKRIPYLQAFIYESIRIRSAAPNLLPKIVPPQGETICGTFIPGGTSLAMNTQSLLRCRKVSSCIYLCVALIETVKMVMRPRASDQGFYCCAGSKTASSRREIR